MEAPRPGTYRVELFDRFEDVDSRINDGRKWMLAISDFFTKKAQLEKEYSKKLNSLLKSTNDNDFGSVCFFSFFFSLSSSPLPPCPRTAVIERATPRAADFNAKWLSLSFLSFLSLLFFFFLFFFFLLSFSCRSQLLTFFLPTGLLLLPGAKSKRRPSLELASTAI